MENNQTKQAPKKSIFALDSDDELDNESNEIIKIRNTLVTSATLDQLEILLLYQSALSFELSQLNYPQYQFCQAIQINHKSKF